MNTKSTNTVDATEVFATGEGDAWFERRREWLLSFDAARDLPLRLLRLFGARPRRALEVGAANGPRLSALRREFGSEVVGVDLSAAAVADGRERYGLDLRVQAAHELSLEGRFDLVIVNFVLHWVARERLEAAVVAIDAQLEPGGLLLLGDFHPDEPTAVPYHHRTDVELFTHKRDYTGPFLLRGDYRLIGFLSGDHAELEPRSGVASAERVGLWLLEKRSEA